MVVKILVSFIFTFLSIYIFFSFPFLSFSPTRRKEAVEVGESEYHPRKYALGSAGPGSH